LIALFLIIQHFGSLTFTEAFPKIAQLNSETGSAGLLTAIGILLMVGAAGKSAQIPLCVWLPDAMEGPTPVSALIHAATMVTAGVYMVSRSHVIFERAPMALTVIAIIGTLTALFAATIGITQTDIKKVLAYSTVSQLGYMFIACGVGAFSAGVFHLMTHAFFKGLLFLGAGSVIHAVGGEQDMRKMGGLRTKIPWTFWTVTAGTIAIAGIPPFAGFFSKDEILWKAYQQNWVYWFVGLVTAFITSFYMFRMWFLTFFGEYKGDADSHDSHGLDSHGHDSHGHGGVHESPMVMLVPLMILAVLSIVGGWVGIGGRFEHFLAPVFQSSVEGAHEAAEASGGSMEEILMLVSVAVALSGLGLAWLLYIKKPQLPKQIAEGMGSIYRAVFNKYYVDEFYARLFIKPLLFSSTNILWKGVDKGMIDAALDGSAHGAHEVSDSIRHMQSGNLRSYAGWIAAGAAAVIVYMIWVGTR
jgi:NADH-quinone oxidoreductase subunit L